MKVTTQFKKKIVAELLKQRENFAGTDAAFARMLGIRSDIYSRMKNGEIDRVIKDPAWYSLASKYNIGLVDQVRWVTARTETYEYITTQLAFCQEHSVGGLFCDRPDIGKTFTARDYVKRNKNAVYIDCSQSKTKEQFVRAIAKEFGVNYIGSLKNVYTDLVYYLKSIENPIIILDEAGDLLYSAFLEIKALWNATEYACAWYMMGAEGLRKKIKQAIAGEKVGFAEIFSREGGRFQRVSPETERENSEFAKMQAATILKANAPEADMQQVLAKVDGSLRRIYIEVNKLKRA